MVKKKKWHNLEIRASHLNVYKHFFYHVESIVNDDIQNEKKFVNVKSQTLLRVNDVFNILNYLYDIYTIIINGYL